MDLKKYSISEAAQITGYQSHVLRFYEKEFDIAIPRNSSNHRYYTLKEIEIFQYIKHLQEKGLTNNQIKLILNSPEVIQNHNIVDETAITISPDNIDLKDKQEFSLMVNNINDTVNEGFNHLADGFQNSIEKVLSEIHSLKNEITEKDQDVILCENAKLKMKIKQKSYEIAELKEQLKREKNRKRSIFKKIFKK